jgi:hypothetical protein
MSLASMLSLHCSTGANGCTAGTMCYTLLTTNPLVAPTIAGNVRTISIRSNLFN